MQRVDTLLIPGCTTRGCIRPSVIDTSAYGLRPIVVEECVGGRAEGAHRANLFDMDQKYADAMPLSEVLDRQHKYQARALDRPTWMVGTEVARPAPDVLRW